MSRNPHPPRVSERYWNLWFDRIRELHSQTGYIQNYAGYIYKKLKKEGFWPNDKQLTTRLRKWRRDGKLVHPETSASQLGPVNDDSSAKATNNAQNNYPNRGGDTSLPYPVNDDFSIENIDMDWAGFIQATGGEWEWPEEGMQYN